MKHWSMFGLLSLIWGTSFLLIKIALAPDGTSPAAAGLLDSVALAGFRLSLGALGFLVLIALTHRKLPTDPRTIAALIITGLVNNALPFMLITWGEKTIDSGLATVLDATVPLFGVVIAHFALHDDKISLGKIFGLISGFAGVILLATRSADPTHPNPISGQLAVIGAAFCYAVATVFMRRTLRHLDTTVTAGLSISAGAIIVLGVMLLTVRPLPVIAALQPGAIEAVVVLGILNTFVAYLLFFGLISAWGVTRSTMVTYAMVPTGVIVGAVFNHEPIDWKMLVGTVLIVGGVALASMWRAPLRQSRREVVAEASG